MQETTHALDARDHARARSPGGGQGARANARSTGSNGNGEAASTRRRLKHSPLTFNRPITHAHSQTRATYRTSEQPTVPPHAPLQHQRRVLEFMSLCASVTRKTCAERHVQKEPPGFSARIFSRMLFEKIMNADSGFLGAAGSFNGFPAFFCFTATLRCSRTSCGTAFSYSDSCFWYWVLRFSASFCSFAFSASPSTYIRVYMYVCMHVFDTCISPVHVAQHPILRHAQLELQRLRAPWCMQRLAVLMRHTHTVSRYLPSICNVLGNFCDFQIGMLLHQFRAYLV